MEEQHVELRDRAGEEVHLRHRALHVVDAVVPRVVAEPEVEVADVGAEAGTAFPLGEAELARVIVFGDGSNIVDEDIANLERTVEREVSLEIDRAAEQIRRPVDRHVEVDTASLLAVAIDEASVDDIEQTAARIAADARAERAVAFQIKVAVVDDELR